MTVYRVKLHDKASSESRIASVAADSKDEAVWIEVGDLETKAAEGMLSGRDKARLQSHRQSKPYLIVKSKEGEK